MSKDYYDVLGVSREVDDASLKKSYRKLAMKFHPDRNPDDKVAEDKFKELGEAYEVLSDADKRAAYDRMGHDAYKNGGGNSGFGGGGGGFGGGVDPRDIFSQMFGGMGGGGFGGGGQQRRATPARPGADLRYDLDVSLEEASTGCDKTIEIERLVPCETCHASGSKDGKAGYKTCATCQGQGVVTRQSGFFVQQTTCPSCRGAGQSISNPCNKCHGEGRVHKDVQITLHIPAGVDNGNKLRSTNNGDAGICGGQTGDLYVFIDITAHNIFTRDGRDLHCSMPIPFSLAVEGGQLRVPTLQGHSTLKIAAGTQNQTTFKLRDKGIPSLKNSSRGDLLVEVEVELPTDLNREQKKSFGAFMASLTEKNQPESEQFKKRAANYLK